MRTNIGKFLQVPVDFRKKSSQSFKSNNSISSHFPPTNKGTIRPNPNLNAELAARELNAAFQGVKSDAARIISILTSHSNHQRQKIKRHYRILYVKELENDIISDLGGHFRDVALALLQTPQDFVAENIHETLKIGIEEAMGLACASLLPEKSKERYEVTTSFPTCTKIRPEEVIFVELLSGRSNSRLRLIKESYYKKYGRELEIAVKREMNSDLRRIMRILLTSEREEKEVDVAKAHKEAQMLAHAGVGMRYGTDDAVIAELLLRRSYTHLREMFAEFQALKHQSIEDCIRLDFRGGLRDGLLALVKAVNDPVEFFADRIRAAFRDPDPNDHQLIRLCVARAELDLADIKDCYVEMYDTKLATIVTEETRGDYRRILLRLLGY